MPLCRNPNGGTVDSRALTHGGGQDASRPPTVETTGALYPLTTDFRIENNQLIVSDLLNNSAVRLADGIGFTNPGYTFIGWSTSPNGADGSEYRADSIHCYVDTQEPLVLYKPKRVSSETRRRNPKPVMPMLKSARFYLILLLALLFVLAGIRHNNSTDPLRSPERTSPIETKPPSEPTEAIPSDTPAVQAAVLADRANTLPESADPEETAATEDESASVPYISERKIAEITGKLDTLSAYCSDLTGWIYMADSDIDYPVVQGTDNQYYLHHTPDGRRNQLSSIFQDYRCARDFSDRQNILFGHNMEYSMFGDIRSFKEQSEFEKHRYGWLFTRDALYRIDFYALVIVSAYDAIYDVPADSDAWQNAVRENSLHFRETEISPDDHVVALST